MFCVQLFSVSAEAGGRAGGAQKAYFPPPFGAWHTW